MNRREFGNLVGLGMIATSLPVAIAACKSPEATSGDADPCAAAPCAADPCAAPAAIDETPRDDGFAALGTVADLDAAGFLAKKGFIAGPVIVIRDPANADSVIALDSMCVPTRAVRLNGKTTPSPVLAMAQKFNTDGSVATGPATEPLSSYDAIIDGDLVLVKAA